MDLSFLKWLLLASSIAIAIHHFITKSSSKKLPPGPNPLPIIGNLLSLGKKPHISLYKLAKTYGPIMTLQLGQLPTIIISSSVVAKEALQKNNINLSNRSLRDSLRALNHHENSVIWLPISSSKWRTHRKICNSYLFCTSRLENTQHLRENKVKDVISYVRQCSEAGVGVDIGQVAFSTSLNLLSNTFFSKDLGDPNSEFVREFKNMVLGVMVEIGRPNLSDYFPILRWVDPQGIRRRSSVYFGKMQCLFRSIISQRLHDLRSSRSNHEENDVLDEFLGMVDDQKESGEFKVSSLPNLLQDLFIAGTDTTSSTIEWAMAELLQNPRTLKKAQEELQQIVGKQNPVKEPHISKLPYLQAIVKETFRLHPAAPFLVPRQAHTDFELFGYTIPKNSQVLVNVWAIGRDPSICDNPNVFEPERFIGSTIDVKGHDFELIPFGSGRRICLGLPLAVRMLHLMLASLIHEFDWKVDAQKMDMEERFGLSLRKAQPLRAIPIKMF